MEKTQMPREHLLQNSQALLYRAPDLSVAKGKPLKSLTNQWDQKIAAKQISLIHSASNIRKRKENGRCLVETNIQQEHNYSILSSHIHEKTKEIKNTW